MEVKGFYKVTPLRLFRKTEGVVFDIVPEKLVEQTSSIDRVLHKSGAVSPGEVGEVKRPWYMHYHQQDNLLVLQGHREVELYSPKLKEKVTFRIYPNKIYCNNELLSEEGVVLTWEEGIFHRIVSGLEGAASLNFAVRSEGFDIKTNFNIYNLNRETAEYKSIRDGFKDQF